MELVPAIIDDEQIEKIRSLENELGKVLLAIEQPRKLAQLSDEQIDELKKTEDTLGCVVVAYQDQS